MYGSPETTTGGRALKFYASLRLDIRRIASIKEGTNLVGSRTRVKIVKNKCAPPFKQAEFDIMFNQGVSREGLLVDMGEKHGIVRRAGAWYSYGDDVRLGQGRENSKTFLRENPDIAEEIEARIREELGIAVREPADAEKEAGEPARSPETGGSLSPRPARAEPPVAAERGGRDHPDARADGYGHRARPRQAPFRLDGGRAGRRCPPSAARR